MPGAPTQSDAPQKGPAWLSTLPPWLLLTAALVGLLFIPAAVLDMLTPDRYLPSPDWLRVSRPAVYALWLVWSLSIIVLVAAQSKGSTVKNAAVTVFSIAIFSAPVGNLVRSSIPALIATVSGVDVQHTYTIVRADGSSDKFCRTPVELEGMPFMTKLCGTGNEFRSHLDRGQTVTFGGKGTWMGLYVEYIQP